jgi:hypothetical protein
LTLVVARRVESNGNIHVTADMRITDHAEIKRGYPFAALKNIILSPSTLVAYAGKAELGMHTIRKLRSAPLDDLGAGLLAASREAGGGKHGLDFLIAGVGLGIQRITTDGIEEWRDTAWIGDVAAFEVYQRAYHEAPVPLPTWVEGISPPKDQLPDPASLEPVIRMANGTMAVQQDESLRTVGEAFVSASSSRGGFRYSPQGQFVSGEDQEIPSGEWVTLHWGSAATGGFGYNLLHAETPGIGLIGLYFPHGSLGLVYHPLVHDDPIVYAGVTHDEFRAAVAEDHEIEIDGPRLT